MWQCEHSVVIQASKAVVWQWWIDVEKWPTWDVDLAESALLAELAVGAQGRMKVADDAIVSFVVTQVIPEERVAFQLKLFGATVTYVFTMADEEAALKVTHSAQVRGIFSFFWRFLLKKKLEKTLIASLELLATQATAESARRAAEPPVAPVAGEPSDEGVPVVESEAPVPAQTPAEPAFIGGDPVENELRTQDIRTQIEVAAQAPVTAVAESSPAQEPAQPGAQESAVEGSTPEEHTAVVAVSPVVTKKETKRPAKK